MAIPAQTTTTPTRIGIREDLDDWISNIAPTETPFASSIGSASASQHYTEWQTDDLVAPNGDNKRLEGDDLENEDRPPTFRMGTYTQIMTKAVGTSTRAQATNTAGRGDEHKYQIAKAAKELKRDKETRYCGNFAAVPGTNTVEGETAGALAWITSNVDRGTGGANGTLSGTTQGYVNAAATNGTLRDFTEAQFKEALHDAWDAGGEPDKMIVGGRLKQAAAGFLGLADQRRETGDKKATIVAGADMYVSDFGNVMFIPSRFTTNRDALIYDSSLWSEATLEPTQRRKLATTGLSDKMAIYCDKALRCHNEKGNAVIADIQPVAI